MIDERWIYLGFALSFYGGFSYLIDTIKGKARPNRVTWFFWALAPMIALAAELQKGVGLPALLTFSVGFNPLLIFIASFINKKSYWELKKLDYFYGSLAFLGIIFWKITGEGNVAIFFSILADALAGAPTIIKAFHEPESESETIYLFGIINAGITLLALQTWDFAHWGFPVYILTICLILYSLIKFRLGEKITKAFIRTAE